MGFPDHLKNMTFAQHQALMEMTEEEDSQMKSIFNKDGVPPTGHLVNQGSGQSPMESQKDLNADLMMQNIYRSEEFLLPPDGDPQINLQGVQTEISEHGGRETLQKMKDSTDSKKLQLDQTSEGNQLSPLKEHKEASMQVTPLSQRSETGDH